MDMTRSRRAQSVTFRVAISLFVLALTACGGGEADSTDGGGSQPANGSDAAAVDGETDGAGGGGSGGGDASATLTVAGEEYNWSGEQMNVCSVDGMFPANADFGEPPSQGGEGPWVQFLDRGDGGINFSAVLDGEEYSGTGGGAADEIRSDGFNYTGMMGSGGERFEVELEVTC